MSHFTVLVVGENIEEQLAPFHEFECTGEDNQYVQDVDVTDEARAKYAEDTTTRLRDLEGELHEPYAPEFYRDPTDEEQEEMGPIGGCGGNGKLSWDSRDWGDGQGYRSKVRFVPEGWEEVRVPYSEVESFRDWIEGWYGHKVVPCGVAPDLEGDHKYGYVLVDKFGEVVKIVDRTNPNAKWDWYELGGRWTGFFKVKEVPVLLGEIQGLGFTVGEMQNLVQMFRESPAKFEAVVEKYNDKADQIRKLVRDIIEDTPVLAKHTVGIPGLMTPKASEGWADSLRKGDIDFEGMREAARQKANETYTQFEAATAGLEVAPRWKDLMEQMQAEGKEMDEIRKAYHNHPWINALHEARLAPFGGDARDIYCVDNGGREAYVARAVARTGTTYAVIKDGEWYSHGEMGWWGMSNEAMTPEEWGTNFQALLDELSDDTLISVVDCHI